MEAVDLLGESLVGLAANEPVRIRPGGWGAEAGPESPEAGNRGGEALRREVTGPDRLGLVLLALSVPTLGATLPLAAVRMQQTSPKVKKLTK